jgi:hypothetical protein
MQSASESPSESPSEIGYTGIFPDIPGYLQIYWYILGYSRTAISAGSRKLDLLDILGYPKISSGVLVYPGIS